MGQHPGGNSGLLPILGGTSCHRWEEKSGPARVCGCTDPLWGREAPVYNSRIQRLWRAVDQTRRCPARGHGALTGPWWKQGWVVKIITTKVRKLPRKGELTKEDIPSHLTSFSKGRFTPDHKQNSDTFGRNTVRLAMDGMSLQTRKLLNQFVLRCLFSTVREMWLPTCPRPQ